MIDMTQIARNPRLPRSSESAGSRSTSVSPTSGSWRAPRRRGRNDRLRHAAAHAVVSQRPVHRRRGDRGDGARLATTHERPPRRLPAHSFGALEPPRTSRTVSTTRFRQDARGDSRRVPAWRVPPAPPRRGGRPARARGGPHPSTTPPPSDRAGLPGPSPFPPSRKPHPTISLGFAAFLRPTRYRPR